MRILNRLGGIALANAYSCIKAISKKKLDSIAKFREEFIEARIKNGMAKKKAEEVFSLIEKFAGYGFNKSHSTAYALIAYMTAYLKAHYKVEFMAALLSSDIPGRNFKKKDSLVEHIEDSQRMNIEVQPPDVNRSDVEFAVSRRQGLLRPLGHQGLRRQRRRRRSSRAARPAAPIAASSTSASGSIRARSTARPSSRW